MTIPEGIYPGAVSITGLAQPGQVVWVNLPNSRQSIRATAASTISSTTDLTVTVDNRGQAYVYGNQANVTTLERIEDDFRRRFVEESSAQINIAAIYRLFAPEELSEEDIHYFLYQESEGEEFAGWTTAPLYLGETRVLAYCAAFFNNKLYGSLILPGVSSGGDYTRTRISYFDGSGWVQDPVLALTPPRYLESVETGNASDSFFYTTRNYLILDRSYDTLAERQFFRTDGSTYWEELTDIRIEAGNLDENLFWGIRFSGVYGVLVADFSYVRGIHVSTDEGATWTAKLTGLIGSFSAIALHETTCLIVTASESYYSTDLDVWDSVSLPFNRIVYLHATSQFILAVVNPTVSTTDPGELWYSPLGALSFEQIDNPFVEMTGNLGGSDYFEFIREVEGGFLASGQYGTLYFSIDGRNWQVIEAPPLYTPGTDANEVRSFDAATL